jgi:hypothetical protein
MPRTIAALAERHPTDTFVVVGSPSYIEAMETDLAQALGALRTPKQLLIVTSRAPGTPDLQANTVPSTAALQPSVSGAMVSLHARVACKMLEEAAEYPLSAPDIRARYLRIARRHAPVRIPSRDRLTDPQVISAIRHLRQNVPHLSASNALRRLRDRGLACEQKRFGRLFLAVQ